MCLLYFLDTYINLVKYLQNVSLDVYINWCCLHQDAGKNYSEISNMRSYLKYSKATICRRMKRNTGDLVVTKKKIREDHQNCLSVVDFCEWLTWNGLTFRGKESCPKMTWNWDLGLLEKFTLNLERATMKYEIIRKPS